MTSSDGKKNQAQGKAKAKSRKAQRAAAAQSIDLRAASLNPQNHEELASAREVASLRSELARLSARGTFSENPYAARVNALNAVAESLLTAAAPPPPGPFMLVNETDQQLNFDIDGTALSYTVVTSPTSPEMPVVVFEAQAGGDLVVKDYAVNRRDFQSQTSQLFTHCARTSLELQGTSVDSRIIKGNFEFHVCHSTAMQLKNDVKSIDAATSYYSIDSFLPFNRHMFSRRNEMLSKGHRWIFPTLAFGDYQPVPLGGELGNSSAVYRQRQYDLTLFHDTDDLYAGTNRIDLPMNFCGELDMEMTIQATRAATANSTVSIFMVGRRLDGTSTNQQDSKISATLRPGNGCHSYCVAAWSSTGDGGDDKFHANWRGNCSGVTIYDPATYTVVETDVGILPVAFIVKIAGNMSAPNPSGHSVKFEAPGVRTIDMFSGIYHITGAENETTVSVQNNLDVSYVPETNQEFEDRPPVRGFMSIERQAFLQGLILLDVESKPELLESAAHYDAGFLKTMGKIAKGVAKNIARQFVDKTAAAVDHSAPGLGTAAKDALDPMLPF